MALSDAKMVEQYLEVLPDQQGFDRRGQGASGPVTLEITPDRPARHPSRKNPRREPGIFA